MLWLLVLADGLVALPTSACPTAPPVFVAVRMDDAAVATRTDFSLAQIEAMRQRTGGVDRHPSLGFYGHRFGYTATVDLEHEANTPCVTSVQVTVHMVLSERVIEIGKELANNPCLYAIAQAHYNRHAVADDQVFGEYARMVAPALKAAQILPNQDDYAFDRLDRKQIERLVNASIDSSLVPYDAARQAAQAAVDTKTEALKMTTGCAAQVPRDGHV